MERFRADCETILENECEVESRIQVENISSFLVNELLIRCANVIVENKELPRALRQNDHFQRLEANYWEVVKNDEKCGFLVSLKAFFSFRTQFAPWKS